MGQVKLILKSIKFKRFELALILIIALEILFPKHAVKAADRIPFGMHQTVEATSLIPFRSSFDGVHDFIQQAPIGESMYLTNIIVTAYTSSPDETDGDPYITAWGTQTRDGVIASNYFSFGTKIRFPDYFGDKIFVVEDRMNPRYHKRVDVWMTDKESARQFGVRYLKAEIVR